MSAASHVPDRNLLEQAAARWQIELEYTDTWGNQHIASSDAICSVLQSFGISTASDEDLRTAISKRDFDAWALPIPSCLTVFEDDTSLVVKVPEAALGQTIKLEFEWESGELQHRWFFLPELLEVDRATLNGPAGPQTFVAKRVSLPAPRLGYHRLRLYWVKTPELELFGDAHFIVCPHRVLTREDRIAGIAMSLYGLRSSRNWGIGDFSDLRVAVDQFAQAGAEFIALNPLHAIPNRQPYNISPYLPECSLYRNFLYLDVERVPGFEPESKLIDQCAALRAAPFVEYERVASLKLASLRTAFTRFLISGGSTELDLFVDTEGAPLHDYAVYCALWAKIHDDAPEIWLWTDWPEQYTDPRSPEVAAFAKEHFSDVLFYKFLQWQVDLQLGEVQDHALASGMKLGLYHDLALATDRFGADLWANRAFYANGARVGAPPDELGPGGQDWGFPPPNREAHHADGYQMFARTIRNTARRGGVLRIDHVMRFFRLFWIPDALTARDGLYVRDYLDDLLRVLALESVRGSFIVIGEDLGTVAPEVRAHLDQAGVLGYRLLWFEKHPDGTLRAPYEYPPRAAVSTTTHDLPTLAGFFQGRDIEARRAAGLVDDAAYERQWVSRRQDIPRIEESLATAGFPYDAISFVLSTPSSIAIINQEDLTGEMEQPNLPATTWEHPNWRRKMLVAVEDLSPLAADLRVKIERSGRI
jgi:4-alpha-glucanotransferase